MTISPPDVLLGNQQPRVHSAPLFHTTLGDDAVDLAAAAGLHLDSWQQFVLRDAMGQDSTGRFSAFEVGLMVPRQNGKGAVIEARELAGLFLLNEQLILHSAHEFKTAKEGYLRVRSLIENTPDLMELVKQFRFSNEDVSVELRSGQRLRFVARSKGSGRGFSGDCVILDEAYELPDEILSALMPTMSARPNPQLWYTSSAGFETSYVLERVRERGLEKSPNLAYFEWSAERESDFDDRDAWRQANPALGIRLRPEFIQAEREAMDEVSFGRERLGIWDDQTTLAVIPADAWNNCRVAESSQIEDPVAVAVDVAWDRSWAAVSVAGRCADGVPQVELAAHQRGTDWIVDAVKRIREQAETVAVVVDASGPAGSLIPAFEELGIDTFNTSGRDMQQACGGFYDAVMNTQLRHTGAAALTAALAGARKRDLGDAWAWARRDVTVDISPLVAATLALYGFLKKSVDTKPKRSGKVW